MENKDELKEFDIKDCRFYYFNGAVRYWDRDIDFSDFY